MKNYVLLLLLLIIALSCNPLKVMTDYDKSIDFSKFNSYQFYEDIGKGLNDLDVKRVTAQLNANLDSLGFTRAEEPDFFINVMVDYANTQSRNTLNVGFGNGGRNGGIGVSGGIPIGQKKLSEEFIIEFVNAKTNELFWEGILVSKVTENRAPELKEIHFKTVIRKILNAYQKTKSSNK